MVEGHSHIGGDGCIELVPDERELMVCYVTVDLSLRLMILLKCSEVNLDL